MGEYNECAKLPPELNAAICVLVTLHFVILWMYVKKEGLSKPKQFIDIAQNILLPESNMGLDYNHCQIKYMSKNRACFRSVSMLGSNSMPGGDEKLESVPPKKPTYSYQNERWWNIT